MRGLIAILLATGGMIFQGCATVTRGTTDVLVIESDPAGAEVEITPAGLRCKTPCSVELKRKHNQLVLIRKEGFEEIQVNVIPQTVGAGSAGMAGNVLVGGLIGAAVDAGSGAMKDLKPNPIQVKMVPLQSAIDTGTAPATALGPQGQGNLMLPTTSPSTKAEATEVPPAPPAVPGPPI